MSYDVGVIIPVYRATPALPALLRELDAALCGAAYHVFLIDDSADEETRAYLERACLYHSVTLIRLAANAGQQNALLCGIRAAAPFCARIATLDDDGQHAPALLPALLRLLPEENGLAYALPARYGKGWRALGSRARDALFCALLRLPQGKRVSSFRAMTGDLARRVAAWQGTFFYLSAVALAEQPQLYHITYPARARTFGKSGYTPGKLLTLWLNIARYYRRGAKQPPAPPPYQIEFTIEGTHSF